MRNKTEVDMLCTVLSVVMQNSTPNALHEAATFSTLMCVSRQLQLTMQQAAAGRISFTVLLASCPNKTSWDTADGHKEGHEMLSDGTAVQRSTTEQLQWVLKRLEQQLCQLTVYVEETWLTHRYEGWEYSRWFLDRLVATVPELASCGLECPKEYALPGSVPFCHGLVVDFAPSYRPPGAPPAPSPLLHMRLAVAVEHGHNSAQDCRAVLKHLPQLTNLQELNLHYYNPTSGTLAPALSALTALTKLYIRHPFLPEQQALPVTLKALTVGRRFEYMHWDYPTHLLPLDLAHLTALEALTIDEYHRFGYSDSFNNANWWPFMCEGVPAGSVLPASVHQLTVHGIRHVEPLLMLTQLKSLNITHMSSRSVMPDTLLALSQLTSLTRVNIRARLRARSELQAYSPAFGALPADLSGLKVEQSDEVCNAWRSHNGQSEDGSHCSNPASCGVLVGMRIVLDVVLGRRPPRALWRTAE